MPERNGKAAATSHAKIRWEKGAFGLFLLNAFRRRSSQNPDANCLRAGLRNRRFDEGKLGEDLVVGPKQTPGKVEEQRVGGKTQAALVEPLYRAMGIEGEARNVAARKGLEVNAIEIPQRVLTTTCDVYHDAGRQNGCLRLDRTGHS